jgi:hypothetical protein
MAFNAVISAEVVSEPIVLDAAMDDFVPNRLLIHRSRDTNTAHPQYLQLDVLEQLTAPWRRFFVTWSCA